MMDAIQYALLIASLLLYCFGETSAQGHRASSDDDDAGTFVSDEERLFVYLFRRYNNRIRPVRRYNETVNVALTFSLKQIHHLEEKVQVFKTYGWLIAEWKDDRLSWPSNQFHNMTQFVVDSSLIWTPELALINAVEHQFPDFTKYRAIISSDGSVRWEPAGVFETSCMIDITFYPYDKQKCSIIFGTWSYTTAFLNLTNSTEAVNLDDYNISGEWNIFATKVERHQFSYECCEEISFSKVAATINLIRRHRFFTLNLVLPCAMLSSLTLVTFLSPPDQGEKISLGISILLSFSVFMLSMSENMPKTSETIPLFGVYTTFVMLMNTWSVMLTVLVLNLHHRNECRPIPGWLRLLAFEGIARLLCMYTPQHVIVYQQRIQDQRRKQLTTVGGSNNHSNAGIEAYKNRGSRHSLYQINEYWKKTERMMPHHRNSLKRRYASNNYTIDDEQSQHYETHFMSDADANCRSSVVDVPTSPCRSHHHLRSPDSPTKSSDGYPPLTPCHHLSNHDVTSSVVTPGNGRPANSYNDHTSSVLSTASNSGFLTETTTTSDSRLLESGKPCTQRRTIDGGLKVTFVDAEHVTQRQPRIWRKPVTEIARNSCRTSDWRSSSGSDDFVEIDGNGYADREGKSDDEMEMVEPDEALINLEMQEWKRLARIMDRLFFWLTLSAIISVSIVLTCMLIWS